MSTNRRYEPGIPVDVDPNILRELAVNLSLQAEEEFKSINNNTSPLEFTTEEVQDIKKSIETVLTLFAEAYYCSYDPLSISHTKTLLKESLEHHLDLMVENKSIIYSYNIPVLKIDSSTYKVNLMVDVFHIFSGSRISNVFEFTLTRPVKDKYHNDIEDIIF